MTLTMNKFGEKLPEDEIFYSDDDSDSEISWVSLIKLLHSYW
jgi:hypothetical protein